MAKDADQERRDRLKAALRENLKRRKTQVRDRAREPGPADRKPPGEPGRESS